MLFSAVFGFVRSTRPWIYHVRTEFWFFLRAKTKYLHFISTVRRMIYLCLCLSFPFKKVTSHCRNQWWPSCRVISRFAFSQKKMALLCNDVFHWLGASIESALLSCMTHYGANRLQRFDILIREQNNRHFADQRFKCIVWINIVVYWFKLLWTSQRDPLWPDWLNYWLWPWVLALEIHFSLTP